MKKTPTSLLESIPLWVLLLAITLLTRAPFFGFDFLNVDEAAHLTGARELLAPTGRLYETFADNKPPVIYFFYALSAVCHGGMPGVRLLAALLLVFPTGLAAAWCFDDRRQRLWAGVLYLALSSAFVASDAQAVNTEMPMLLALAWATVLLRRPASVPRHLAVGALIGLATLAKQPALAFLVAASVRDRRLWQLPRFGALSQLALVLFGSAAVLLGAGAVFWARGTQDAYWFWAWRYNLSHIAQPVGTGALLLRAAKMVAPLAAVWVLPIAAAVLSPEATPSRRLFLWGFACTLAPAFLGGRFFGHYFIPAMFFLACLATPTWVAWLDRKPRLLLSYVTLLPLIFCGVNLYSYHPTWGVADVTFPVHRQVGERIRTDRCSGPLFVWGYTPMLYHFARRRPASRFVVPLDSVSGYLSGNDAFERGELDTRHRIVPAHRNWLMKDLKASAPSHIVDTSPSGIAFWDRFPLSTFPALERFVSNGYVASEELHGMRIFRRVDCPKP